MAGLALLVAICLTVARGAFGQNNFYGISEDFATPPAVRDARERDPTTPLRAATERQAAAVAHRARLPRPTGLTLRPPPPAPSQITWLSPPKGHIKGGTVLTLYGSGFKRSTSAKVRRTPPPGGRRLDWI